MFYHKVVSKLLYSKVTLKVYYYHPFVEEEEEIPDPLAESDGDVDFEPEEDQNARYQIEESEEEEENDDGQDLFRHSRVYQFIHPMMEERAVPTLLSPYSLTRTLFLDSDSQKPFLDSFGINNIIYFLCNTIFGTGNKWLDFVFNNMRNLKEIYFGSILLNKDQMLAIGMIIFFS